jgi:hypothetical protein
MGRCEPNGGRDLARKNTTWREDITPLAPETAGHIFRAGLVLFGDDVVAAIAAKYPDRVASQRGRKIGQMPHVGGALIAAAGGCGRFARRRHGATPACQSNSLTIICRRIAIELVALKYQEIASLVLSTGHPPEGHACGAMV